MTASKLLPEFDDLGTELPGLLQNEHWKTSFVLSVVIFITVRLGTTVLGAASV